MEIVSRFVWWLSWLICLSLLEVAGSIPDSATSRGVSVVDVQLKDPEWSMQPPGLLSRIFEKSGVRVK